MVRAAFQTSTRSFSSDPGLKGVSLVAILQLLLIGHDGLMVLWALLAIVLHVFAPATFADPTHPTRPLRQYQRMRHFDRQFVSRPILPTRRPRQYHLAQRVLRRPIRYPIRDKPRTWFQHLRHWWTPRRIPVPPRPTEGFQQHNYHRKQRYRWTKHKYRTLRKQNRFGRMTPTEAEQCRKDDFERNKSKFLHLSWIMYTAQYGVDFDVYCE